VHSIFRITIILALLLVFRTSGLTEEVYKWVDADGRVQFSTTPPVAGAKPADLPKITRQNIDQRIKDLKQRSALSCAGRGGIDCTQGPDTDGSVICADGFRGAAPPFRFRCTEAKLEVVQMNLLGDDQQILKEIDEEVTQLSRGAATSLQLAVRNLSDVAAEQVSVQFGSSGSSLSFSGPARIEPYAIADYILPLGAQVFESPLAYTVRCQNCRTSLKRK